MKTPSSRQNRRGVSIYEALLALALCGIVVIALNFSAASAAAASQTAKNRLLALNFVRGQLAQYQSRPKELSERGPVDIVLDSKATQFKGSIRSEVWNRTAKLYRLTVSVEWNDYSRKRKCEKSVIVFENTP